MKKILLLLLYIPMIGFGQYLDFTSEASVRKYLNKTDLKETNGKYFQTLNGIAYNIEPDNYHRYDLFSLSKIKHYSSSQTIVKSGNSNGSESNLDAGAFISYNLSLIQL